MSTTDLPDLYARVVAKRPDLAVSNSSYRDLPRFHFTDDIPALILARWVEALPEGHWLAHVQPLNTIPSGWRVWKSTNNGRIISPLRSTPLEALAAFYLGDSQ